MKNTPSPSLSLSFSSFLALFLLGTSSATWGQQVFRCTSAAGGAPEYINSVKEAQTRNCQLISGGNVTVVQGSSFRKTPVRVPAATTSKDSASQPATARPTPESNNPEQRARDSDSRTILEAELKKSESRLAELEKEYNKGEPEKQGAEGRNYQRYLDRVNELKENITRSQSDIAGLKREISRLPKSN